jgi:hypothetical protein
MVHIIIETLVADDLIGAVLAFDPALAVQEQQKPGLQNGSASAGPKI